MSRESHDHNFKNLILDYPREAIAFFAAAEARAIDAEVRILPIREEQLKERLGERFRELDVPLLAEWPDGRRAALLFVFEEETDPRRFSIHRLAHYCLDLSVLCETERVVPVVIFLHPGTYPEQLRLGSETQAYLQFQYLHRALFATTARDYLTSGNLVARLTLPSMSYAPEEKFEVIAAATRGLLELEPDPERRLKYADFIDIYAMLSETEQQAYRHRYPQEATAMMRFSERFIEQGRQEGLQKGQQEGRQEEALQLLSKQIELKFGNIPDWAKQRLAEASQAQLEDWSAAILFADSLEALIGRP